MWFFFNLWRYLKGKVYESNPHNIDDLRKNTRSATDIIEVIVLRKDYINKAIHAQKCTDSQGSHFKHILYECATHCTKN